MIFVFYFTVAFSSEEKQIRLIINALAIYNQPLLHLSQVVLLHQVTRESFSHLKKCLFVINIHFHHFRPMT